MTRKYAERTKVPVDRSKAEIEKLLKRYGAQQFVSAWCTKSSADLIGFTALAEDGTPRQVRVHLPMPNLDDFANKSQRDREYRRRWRALVLVIKAKLEAVESGISTLEREFMSDVVLPDGATVGEWAAKQLPKIYSSGKMPKLLPGMR